MLGGQLAVALLSSTCHQGGWKQGLCTLLLFRVPPPLSPPFCLCPLLFSCPCLPAVLQNQLLANTSGQLQAAAALLVELARAASATSLAAQGNPVALSCNMAAVLRERTAGGLEPSFPTLYPHTTLSQAGTAAATGERVMAAPRLSGFAASLHGHMSARTWHILVGVWVACWCVLVCLCVLGGAATPVHMVCVEVGCCCTQLLKVFDGEEELRC